jgi:hypothetical protein
VFIDGVWAWAPGPRVARVRYSPALVAFFGGTAVARPIGWVALGWGEPVVPWWGPPAFARRPWWGGWGGPRVVNNVVVHRTTVVNVTQVNVYRNTTVKNAVVAVPADRFGRDHVRAHRVHAGDEIARAPIRGRVPIEPIRVSARDARRGEPDDGRRDLGRDHAGPRPIRGADANPARADGHRGGDGARGTIDSGSPAREVAAREERDHQPRRPRSPGPDDELARRARLDTPVRATPPAARPVEAAESRPARSLPRAEKTPRQAFVPRLDRRTSGNGEPVARGPARRPEQTAAPGIVHRTGRPGRVPQDSALHRGSRRPQEAQAGRAARPASRATERSPDRPGGSGRSIR